MAKQYLEKSPGPLKYTAQHDIGVLPPLHSNDCVFHLFHMQLLHTAPVEGSKTYLTYQQEEKGGEHRENQVTNSKDVDQLCLIVGRARPPLVN